jgi:hypothetical protein
VRRRRRRDITSHSSLLWPGHAGEDRGGEIK